MVVAMTVAAIFGESSGATVSSAPWFTWIEDRDAACCDGCAAALVDPSAAACAWFRRPHPPKVRVTLAINAMLPQPRSRALTLTTATGMPMRWDQRTESRDLVGSAGRSTNFARRSTRRRLGQLRGLAESHFRTWPPFDRG